MDLVGAVCCGHLVRRVYAIESCIMRKKAVQEIFDTEMNFVTQLNVLISEFKKPLEDAGGRILPKLVLRTLFSNIDQVMTAACINANIFQKAVVEWKYDSCFGKCMLGIVWYFLDIIHINTVR